MSHEPKAAPHVRSGMLDGRRWSATIAARAGGVYVLEVLDLWDVDGLHVVRQRVDAEPVATLVQAEVLARDIAGRFFGSKPARR
ncbi:hypothetical protein ACQQ2N_01150 [Dokdonella sp. MW10]|uniref:hypothetical protein n=1 Tax=Dokdonella sp. MW10 TaxID=2992926 RepID=UPI003F7F0F93